jgi:Ca2+-binding RTX toxin-like protein
METGAGRFAIGSQFSLIQRFFYQLGDHEIYTPPKVVELEDSSPELELEFPTPNPVWLPDTEEFTKPGRYTKAEIAKEFGMDSYGWPMQQYNWRDESDDYAERVYIYNTQEYMISDDAIFVVDSNGDKWIENFAIEPRVFSDEPDNFDFDGGNLFTNTGNSILEPLVDPSGIGRKVNFDYVGTVPKVTYDRSSYEKDLEKRSSFTYVPIRATLLQDMYQLTDELFDEGVTQFLDEQDRPIIYAASRGTAPDMIAFGDGFITAPKLEPYLDNGVLIVGSSQNDTIEGSYRLVSVAPYDSPISTEVPLDSEIQGNGGNDILNGRGGNDTLQGGADNDSLNGQDGNDELQGEEGNDTLDGGNGLDTLIGGPGDDFIEGGGKSFDYFQSDGDKDELYGGDGNDTLNGDGDKDTLIGGDKNDLLNGGDGDDELQGGSGDDTLKGGFGHDTLIGGTEDDSMDGEAWNDELQGNEGNDTLKGGFGQDTLIGGANNDSLNGDDGNDILYGGIGYDTLIGGPGDDSMDGEGWNDLLEGGAGNDTLNGGDVSDTLVGGGNNDLLNGGDGPDKIDGETGNDTLNGDGSNDIFIAGPDNDYIDGGANQDIVIFRGSEEDYIKTPLGNGYFEFRDTISGRDGTDTLTGVEFIKFLEENKDDDEDDENDNNANNDDNNGDNGDLIPLTTGQDVALVIDRTTSMGDDIRAVQSRSNEILDAALDSSNGLNSRISVVGYNNSGPITYTSFTSDPGAAKSAIDSISLSGGYEPVNGALIHSLSGGAGSWRPDASARRIFLFGDEPADDPELRDRVLELAADVGVGGAGSRESRSISRRSNTEHLGNGVAVTRFAVQTRNASGTEVTVPVEIFTIVIGSSTSSAGRDFAQLSATGGEGFTARNANEAVDALIEALRTPISGLPVPGREIKGTSSRDTLTGGSGDDTIIGFQNRDTLTGGGGSDSFVYESLLHAGDIITDFEPGSDKIIFTEIFNRSGYEGNNPIADGYLKFANRRGTTIISLDHDGPDGPGRFRSFIAVQNVSVDALNDPINFGF